MSISRADARRYTRISQVAAILMAVGAVAAATMDRSRREEPSGGPPIDLPPGDPGTSEPKFEAPDIELIASAFQPDGPPKVEGVKQPDTGEKPPEPPQEASNDLRYLGSIITSARRLALVSIDGVQHLVPEGGDVDGHTITAVGRDRITVDGPAGPREVKKSDRIGEPITTMASSQGGVGRGSPVRGEAGATLQAARDRLSKLNRMTPEEREQAERENMEELDRNAEVDKLREEALKRQAERRGKKGLPTPRPTSESVAPPQLPPGATSNGTGNGGGEQGP